MLYKKESLLLLLSLLLQMSFAYRKYYVEDECISPKKEQKITFRLPSSGPDSVGEMRSNRFGTYSRLGRECIVHLVPPKGYGVIVTVLKVDFRNHEACKDFIRIFTDEVDGEKLCGYQELGFENKTYYSGDKVKVLYHTSAGGMGFHDGFRLVFTVTKIGNESDDCSSSDQFRCRNSHCIWVGVTCDGINNCGDASDETSSEHPYCRTYLQLSEIFGVRLAEVSPVALAAVILGITSFVSILIAICVCCCRSADRPAKPPLIDDFPWRPNAGYIPLPGYTYGSVDNGNRHMPSAPYASAPMEYSSPCPRNQGFPYVQQKVEIRYDRPPPYRA